MPYHLVNGAAYYVRDGAYRPAPPELVLDSFEDQSLAEYDGDTSVFYTESATNAPHGDYVLTSPAGVSSTDIIGSSSGLAGYPTRGETWDVFVWFDGLGDRSGHLFGMPDTSTFDAMLDNHFRVMFETGTGYLTLGEAVNGATATQRTSVTWNAQVWYRVRLTWYENGDVTADVVRTDTDASVVTFTKTGFDEHDGQGFGFWNASGASYDHHYDYVRLPPA